MWQKVRLVGALEAQRRGPPLRDAVNADGEGGGAARGGGDGGCDLPFMPDHDEHDRITSTEFTLTTCQRMRRIM
jgi:hypothetical protein